MPPEALVGAPMAPGPGLVGRQTELDSIGDFLDALSTATPDSARRLPRAVSIQGSAGIGKTVLWLDAVPTAERRGVRVLRARPAEAEAALAYAALQDPFRQTWPALASRLPGRQLQALEVALGRWEAVTSRPRRN